jgi:hypothetical protein
LPEQDLRLLEQRTFTAQVMDYTLPSWARFARTVDLVIAWTDLL